MRVADRIYCTSVEGEIVVLAARKEFEELGRSPLGEGSRSTPAIAGGWMYIRTFSKLMSIGESPLRPVTATTGGQNPGEK